jgi:uncharacterized protein (DUF362 family)/NAD-dependent dihydropyrimidine dehydrogenase PreA subunit
MRADCREWSMPVDVVLRSGFDGYDRSRLSASLEEMVEICGGWPSGAENGATVLLKVNMLSAKEPRRAITTHPEIVAAVARLLQNRGCRVQVGDSPGGAVKGLERYWDRCGYSDVASELDLELVNFEKSGSREVQVNGRSYNIASPVLDADVVINLCKFKTHGLCRLTNAVKNAFGAVPGLGKAILHSRAVRPAAFARLIVDVYEAVPFQMHIMDAILAMDGKGPSTDGNPRMDGILGVSPDGVCLDIVMSRLAGLEPMKLRTNKAARDRGIGKDPGDIMVEGLETCCIDDFRIPRESFYNLLPPFLGSLVRFLFKKPPMADGNCTGCGICVEGCPTGAIRLVGGRAVMSRRKCIMCLCCHELCPQRAVRVRIPFGRG